VERSKPEHDLEGIKRLVACGHCRVTIKAQQFGYELGYSPTEIKDTILGLEKCNFKKSITERANYRIWQDVYIKKIKELELYIKVKITKGEEPETVILSFKRNGDEREKP
jgi:hypothetical protein